MAADAAYVPNAPQLTPCSKTRTTPYTSTSASRRHRLYPAPAGDPRRRSLRTPHARCPPMGEVAPRL